MTLEELTTKLTSLPGFDPTRTPIKLNVTIEDIDHEYDANLVDVIDIRQNELSVSLVGDSIRI